MAHLVSEMDLSPVLADGALALSEHPPEVVVVRAFPLGEALVDHRPLGEVLTEPLPLGECFATPHHLGETFADSHPMDEHGWHPSPLGET